MKKRIAVLFLVFILVVAFCSTIQLSAAPKVLKLAENQFYDYPTTKGDLKFAELVSLKTGGRIQIQVFAGGQLGSENECLEQVKLGVIEAIRCSISPVVTIAPEIGVFNLPYIFKSQDHMWKVLNGEIGQYFLDSVQKAGLVGLTYFDAGARHFYAKKPISKPADLKGLKIRVQLNPINIKFMDAFGANGVAVPFAEVYSALQTGVCDAAENNIPSWVSKSHNEVAKYLLLDGHWRLPEVLMVSKMFWDTLSDADKKAIKDAAKEATAYQIQVWNEYEKTSLAQAKAKGAVIKKANIAEFQKIALPFYDTVYNMPEYKDLGYKQWVEKIQAVK
jgi:tripartite ATP-independent transporter DctP family solute receptor